MNADSNVDHAENKPQEAAQQPPAATPTTSTNEAGHVPQPSQAPVSVLVVNRGPGGKWAPTGGRRQEEAKEPPAEGNSAAAAVLPEARGIAGLDAIPKGWPDLPSNVSLGQDIAWVQSERLRVVKETSRGNIKVDLSKAKTPAPSMSALSWLETSIRSYAKFIEVASKQASSGQDEAEFVRKERMAIGEIDALLAEMCDAEG